MTLPKKKTGTPSKKKIPAKKKPASLGRRCAGLLKTLTSKWMKGGCTDDEIVEDIKTVSRIKLHEKVETMGKLFDKLHKFVTLIDAEQGAALEKIAEAVLIFDSPEEMEKTLEEIVEKYKS